MRGELRVLVVEDDRDIREVMADCLRARYTVQVAEDGISALRLLTGQEFDGIVVDLELPDLSGAALLREVRRRGSRVPALMVSAAPDAGALASDIGVDFLSKPFDLDQFEAKVAELLDVEHANAALMPRRRRSRAHVN